VWVLRDGRPLAVRIRTGITDGSSTEVVDGDLHEGDPVITDSSGGSASAGSGAAPFRRVF
jgi:HlyD family secretion protein